MTENPADGDGGCSPTILRNEAERLREMQLTIAASSSVFPGFRFSPTDEELISYYLKKKLQGSDNCVDIISEVDFCRHEPWDLPALSIVRSDNEWFFFSTRGKKYPNGSQSKRATQYGYWKATGKERNVKSGTVAIGTKRTLVFHMGRAPKGERTEWIMHEYCINDTSQESLVVCRLRRNGDFRLSESSRGSNDHRNLSTTDNGSSDHKNLSTTDNGTSGTNQSTNTQVDGFDDHGNGRKSCSKESTGSYTYHSIEQNESESESDPQIHESAHGSTSPYKDEDDCFADIINDDIINLDESTSNSLTYSGVLTRDLQTKCIPKMSQETISDQGTTLRRIRLKRQKIQTQDIKNKPLISHDGDQNQQSEKKSSGCVISAMVGNSNSVSLKHVILVFLFLLLLLVLVVGWHGDYLDSKQHVGISMEGSKKQLKYWMHKAADYI